MLEKSGSLANSATQQHSSPINELSENVNSKEKQIANIKLLNEVSELQSYILLSINQIIQKDIDEPRSRESAILISNFRLEQSLSTASHSPSNFSSNVI